MARSLNEQIAALEALQQAAWDRRYETINGQRVLNEVQETLFHCIGSAFDNAVDTSVEEGFAQDSDRFKEIYLGSLWTDNVKVRDILNAHGFYF